MYLKKIKLEYVGPIGKLDIDLPFTDNKPKPIVLVGENGTGKSITLSFIVNALISARQIIYENSEVEKGKVYKLRSSSYIRSNNRYYLNELEFEENLVFGELQLNRTKKQYEEYYNECILTKYWKMLPENEFSYLENSLQENEIKLKELEESNVCLYFPPNRFEEPAWLNKDNLVIDASFMEPKNIRGITDRNIISQTVLKNLQNWILDIIYDGNVLDRGKGTASVMLNEINKFIKILFNSDEDLSIRLGQRTDRRIAVVKNKTQWTPSLFHLSSGESVLLSLFCNILRDYDLMKKEMINLENIRGIVLIDEIDLHLHTTLQKTILPKLIKLFPHIQFIITTHSPFFLLGMKDIFGEDGFEIREMPNGKQITTERFREFETAYNAFKETEKYEKEIDEYIKNSKKPVIFVEGDYDIKYLKKAALVLGKETVLRNFIIKEANGWTNLDKIWNKFDTKLAEVVENKIILLYDCDTKKQNSERGNVYKRLIKTVDKNPIKKGIENLFSKDLINRAIKYKKAFIDINNSRKDTIRGKITRIDRSYSVNSDEKRNLCEWICDSSKPTKSTFKEFSPIFEYLENFVKSNIKLE